MVNRFRHHYKQASPDKYYISAAPQCPIPDVNLGLVVMSTYFDFIFVQFYNNHGCSARDFITDKAKSGFTLSRWIDIAKMSPNPSAKVLIGLPASKAASELDKGRYYITPNEVLSILVYLYPFPENFGGIMLWDATYSENNQIDGKSYAQNVKEKLGMFAS